MAAPKFQSSSTKEKIITIAQEHTNKKIHLRENDEIIEQNEQSLKSKNLKAENPLFLLKPLTTVHSIQSETLGYQSSTTFNVSD